MNVQLLFQICGFPLVAILATVSLGLTLAAVLLSVRVRREDLLRAFLPLCLLPLMVAVGYSLFDSLDSIDVQLNAEDDSLRDSGFLLSMNLIPLQFGAFASTLPALVAMFGRWNLAWQASGIELFRGSDEDNSPDDPLDSDAWVQKETDDYLDQLVRPR
ncbi:hypothetical protein FYK55_20890 [Roseiconus nitratireducens]|uniref:Uncharacterized protein n=1 Tax=Roseiconus nitratireducens TaxID=2605748 RepID=A0A5M6D1F7_9BACT|nr:hypothetical protein [Roseiconus nitratireducens]KAA5540470.1 hypothetical protein FYK55_20890 [Roseiconus nitratireducens]